MQCGKSKILCMSSICVYVSATSKVLHALFWINCSLWRFSLLVHSYTLSQWSKCGRTKLLYSTNAVPRSMHFLTFLRTPSFLLALFSRNSMRSLKVRLSSSRKPKYLKLVTLSIGIFPIERLTFPNCCNSCLVPKTKNLVFFNVQSWFYLQALSHSKTISSSIFSVNNNSIGELLEK